MIVYFIYGAVLWCSLSHANVRDPPSGRVPEQGPDWFLVATEACGGGTPDLGFFLGVSVFIGIFGVGLTSGGLRIVHDIGTHA